MEPSWHDDVPPDAKAICKGVGLDWQTLPRKFFMDEPAPVIVAPPAASVSDVTDAEWEILKRHLPGSARKNAADYRTLLSALAYKRASGVRFVSIPARFGSAGSLRKRAERLGLLGAWSALLEALPHLELDPARRQLFTGIAREWASVGMRLMKARGIEPPKPRAKLQKPAKNAPLPPATAAWMRGEAVAA